MKKRKGGKKQHEYMLHSIAKTGEFKHATILRLNAVLKKRREKEKKL